MQIEKKRKDYAFRRQFNEKPSIIPGCPEHHANKAVMLDMAAPVLLVLKGKPSAANTAVSLTAIIKLHQILKIMHGLQ